MNSSDINIDPREEEKRNKMEKSQANMLDRLISIGIISETHNFMAQNQIPFNVLSSEQRAREIVDPEELEKSGTRRLMSGNSFKMAQMLITGTIASILWLILFPRLITEAEVFGITSVVATILGLLGSILDWGVYTGFQMMISRSIGNNNEKKTENYVKTLMSFKIINGVIFNLLVLIFVIIILPKMGMFLEWQNIYIICFIFFSLRWLAGFGAIFEHIIAAGKRFDAEFYMSLISLANTVVLKLFFLWFFGTFFFPHPDPTVHTIQASSVAIVISDSIEIVLRYIMQGYVIKKLKIIPMSSFKPGFKKEEFKEMMNYGTFIVGRTVLSYFSEAGSFLWIVLVSISLQSTSNVEFIGQWNLAVSMSSVFLITTTMTRPIFPAISEAYIKEQRGLIQKYCDRAAKWFFRWAILILGIYIFFGEHILLLISGNKQGVWVTSGQIVRVIAPAYFLKFGNEYLIGILNAIGKPKKVLIGTAFKIPVMIVLFLLVPIVAPLFSPLVESILGVPLTTDNFGLYATIFFMIELVFALYLLVKIKQNLKLEISKIIWIIPTFSCILGIILPGFIFWRVLDVDNRGILVLLSLVLLYVMSYYLVFMWLGGMEESDWIELEISLKGFMKDKIAIFFVNVAKFISIISPLVRRNKSKLKNQ